jgi:hypothetical protein
MYMLPLWRKYPEFATDPWHSLAIFLEGYAFERQGRNPGYFHAAVDALFYCKQQSNSRLTPNVVYEIWEQFSQLLDNQNLNPKNNPLFPQQGRGQKVPLIQAVLNESVQPHSTLTTYLQNRIIRENDIQPAFDFLKSIRGIGNKVASFYLRDLVVRLSIDLSQTRNRELLQPIDIWVKRTITILADYPDMDNIQVANWIVTSSVKSGLNLEQINMGIWFFCSQIVGSQYRLKKVLSDLREAEKLVFDFKKRVENLLRNC